MSRLGSIDSSYESGDLQDRATSLKLFENVGGGGDGAQMAQFVSMASDTATGGTADPAAKEVAAATAVVEELDSGLSSGATIPEIKGTFDKVCLPFLRQ